MTHIAGCELGAERAALLEVSSGGLLTCRAACNISAVELNTGKISSKVSQIYAVQQNKPLLLDEERHVFLSLPLETAKARWVLWLESEYALETLRGISNADQAAFTLLFESELRKIEAGKPKPARLAAGEQEQAQAEPYRDTPEILLHGSAIMRRLLSHGRQIGATDAPVLILGETGVGKELLAHYIHDCSGRTGPFVPVHPASIPDGLFESEFFGHEKGSVHRGHPAENRSGRNGASGDAVHRRGRRYSGPHADQVAARLSGSPVHARWRRGGTAFGFPPDLAPPTRTCGPR